MTSSSVVDASTTVAPDDVDSMRLLELVKRLPKTELHLHIEGTLEPELMFELAQRNKVKLRFDSVEEVRSAYSFKDLQSFLDIYYEGAQVLLHQADFHDLAMAYFRRAQADGVRHCEIFFDPQTHTDRGVELSTVIEGLVSAVDLAREELGMSAKLILCFLRHLPAEQAMATLESALPYRDSILAVGLDSSEKGFPPSLFREVFDRARKEGLLTVAHAGEEGPPAYIAEALDLLHVRRVDHGVRCEESPELVERLVKERIPLTVCPLSNTALKVYESLDQHNLKRLLDAGVLVTINSDDPAFFGGYVLKNYEALVHAKLGLAKADWIQIARNGVEASLGIDSELRATMLQEILALEAEQC